MTAPSLVKRLETREASAPEQQEIGRRTFLGGLSPHRGLTVIIRKFNRSGESV